MRYAYFPVLVFSFFIISYKAKAQLDFWPGHIIHNSDTIIGYIAAQTDELNCQQCLFKYEKDGEIIKYLPGEIDVYQFENGRYFISKSIKPESSDTLVFIEFLVNGISNLYYYRGNTKDYYFVEKDSADMTELTQNEIILTEGFGRPRIKPVNSYKGALRYYYRDCPEIFSAIDNTYFDHKSLIKISEKYHNKVCPDEDCIIYSKSTITNVYFGPRLGFNYNLLGLKTSSDYTQNKSFEIGFQFRFIPMVVYYRWNLLAGIEYSSVSYTGYFTNTLERNRYTTNYESVWDIYLKNQILKIPVKVQYTFPTKIIQPSIFVGYDNIFVFKSEHSLSDNYGGTNFYELETDYSKYLSGITCGIGISHVFNNQIRIYFESEYEFRIRIRVGSTKERFENTYEHCFGLIAGMDFPIK